MRLREDDPPAPAGYDTWQPRMGRGGKFVVWLILAMILVGSALMFVEGFGRWF